MDRVKLSALLAALVEAGRELERTEGRQGRPEAIEQVYRLRQSIFDLWSAR